MIEQSLCHYLQSRLTDYYRLVAILETQLSSRQDQEADSSIKDCETSLSLRRLDVWVNDWRLRMRMMSVCVEGARGLYITAMIKSRLKTILSLDSHGGALVNLIHGYTDNGDPFIRKFTDDLLEEVRNRIEVPIFHLPTLSFRSPVLFLRHCINGCFLVNFMTPLRNSSSLRIRAWVIPLIFTHPQFRGQLAPLLMTEALEVASMTMTTRLSFG